MYQLRSWKLKKHHRRNSSFQYIKSQEEKPFTETAEETKILDQCRKTALSVAESVFIDEFQLLKEAIEMVKQKGNLRHMEPKAREEIDYLFQPGQVIEDAEMKKPPFCLLSQEEANMVQLLPLVLGIASETMADDQSKPAKETVAERIMRNGCFNK